MFSLGWNRVMDGIEKALELGYNPVKVSMEIMHLNPLIPLRHMSLTLENFIREKQS